MIRVPEQAMTYEEFFDALSGLHAYDDGCTDSGIHDEALRGRVKAFLHTQDAGPFLTRFVRELVSIDAEEQGYGASDVASLIRWLSDSMGCDL